MTLSCHAGCGTAEATTTPGSPAVADSIAAFSGPFFRAATLAPSLSPPRPNLTGPPRAVPSEDYSHAGGPGAQLLVKSDGPNTCSVTTQKKDHENQITKY